MQMKNRVTKIGDYSCCAIARLMISTYKPADRRTPPVSPFEPIGTRFHGINAPRGTIKPAKYAFDYGLQLHGSCTIDASALSLELALAIFESCRSPAGNDAG